MHQHLYIFLFCLASFTVLTWTVCIVLLSLGKSMHCVSTINISFSFRLRIRADNILFNKDLKIQPLATLKRFPTVPFTLSHL